MGTRNNKRWQLLSTTLATLTLGLAVTACGGDDEKSPSTGPNIDLDASGPSTTLDGGGFGLDAAVADTGVSTTTDGGVVVNPPVTGDCKGTDGCYSCAPTATTTSPQLLNSCAKGCVPFDNKARIETFTGTLPAL